MILPRFAYHDPSSLDEACQIMAELKEKAQPLAGGTDLIVNMRRRVISPESVVFLGRLDELRGQEISNGRIRIGACMTAAELAESKQVEENMSALSLGAKRLGSPTIRNLATIGGNLVTARPAADLPPPLMAYGAEVVLKNSSGERSVPLDKFFRGPGETVKRPEELLTEIVIEKPPPYSGGCYMRLGRRKTLVISLVNVAAYLSLGSPEGRIVLARVVLGAVAPVPMRATSAEKMLLGEKPSEKLFAKAAEAAAGDSKPIDDFRGSAQYRRAMVEVLTRRALRAALTNAEKHG
ncbi:MAG: xanthine dehydrogenase family protein subunit M [Deltaproteobacteria bacterium]|nr:MAG: xanthine dehydrogenase family protein subunit M [Deltaproteobacteria bacterium]